MNVRRSGARVLTAGAALLAGASSALFLTRYVPPDALPLPSDTVAMVTAFTDLAAPGWVAATLSAIGAVVLRRRRARVVLASVCVVATAAQLALVAPRWVGAPAVPAQGGVTLLALNSRFGQADPAAVVRAARSADLVVLTEATEPQARALAAAGLGERLPYRSTGRLPADGASGTTVYSRFPVTRTVRLSPALANQSWVTTIDLPSGPLTLVAVHPGRPRAGGDRWLREQRALEAALPRTGRRVLAGDFNAVASHPTQRDLVRAGWSSAVDQAGAGWVPTYPAGSRTVPPVIDIDHVYVSPGLQATRVQPVTVAGTDHRGLLVTIAVTSAA